MTETVSKTGKAGDDNIMAALAYFLAPLTSIVMYLMYKDKGNKFMMFHAVQSGIFGVGIYVVMIGWMIVSMLISVITGGFGACIMAPISLLLGLGFFCAWIYLMFKAYKGEKFKIPMVGDMAEKHSG